MDWPACCRRYLDMLHKNQCYLDDDSANRVMGRQEVAEDLVGPVADHSHASYKKKLPQIQYLNLVYKDFIHLLPD